MNNNIIRSDISKEMKERYIDYAMSVIIDRALPDVRDGLKPVHRRILYAMHELGLTPEKGYRKCARVVGDVLGKYHPHGDSSVYGALVRMAQDFSMRYMLVDGHGNFGSIDGDGAAAMRYTECKMDKIAAEMLRDINKNTVDFIPNFDGEEKEPSVLPSRFPNLLVNGCDGIAVGMATNIPPHNLSEVIDGIITLIDNPNLNINELTNYIKAPDFPLGGVIVNPENIEKIYTEGKGKVILRSKYHIEKTDKHKLIVFTDIPYQVNKAKVLEKISDLVHEKDKILKVITDIRDESDKNGIRMVVELKRNADENVVLAQLFKKTNLQCNYNAIFCTIVNNEPKILNLKQILHHYIEFQKEVLTRRSKFDLEKSQKRIHILNALKIAIDNIDKTIKLIKNSKNGAEAKIKLSKELNIDEIQAQAILDLKLQRLTSLDKDNIENEFKSLQLTINNLQSILSDEAKLLKLLKQELLEIKNKFGEPRRTEIIYEDNLDNITQEDLIEDYNCTISYTKNYIKKLKKRSDKNTFKDGEILIDEIPSTNKSTILFFTNKANRYFLHGYDLDDSMTPSKIGEFIPNLIELEEGEEIIKIISVEDEKKGYVISVFDNGKIAKVPIKQFISNYTKIVNCYNTENKLIDIDYIEEESDILLLSTEGKGLIVNTSKISSKQSKNTMGVQGINLGENINNKVIGCIINVPKDQNIKLITKKGKEKFFMLDDVAPTGKPNEERSLFKYIYGNRNTQGNFIINTRINGDEIVKLVSVD